MNLILTTYFVKIFYVILITLLPFLELRYSIPADILKDKINLPFKFKLIDFGLNPIIVILIVIITNIILGFAIYEFLNLLVNILLKNKTFEKIHEKIIERPRRKIKKYVDKYGTIGVAIFTRILLLGSAVYTCALGSFALGIKRKDFYKATIFGVIIAGTIISILTLIFKPI